jgi:hypothetical protein
MEATNLTVANNSISGGAGFDGVRGAGDDDTENHAMMLGGTNVVVRDNHVDGNGGSCLFITRATGFDVADNDCIGTSAGLFGNPGKFHVITSHWYQPQWMTGIVIERNLLEPVFTLGTDQTCDDDCWGRTTCGPDDPQACDSYVADGIHVDGTILTVVRSNTITAVGGDAISGAWLEESNHTGAENVGCAGTAPAPECVPALPSFGTGILFISILAVSAAAIPLFLGVRRSR